MGLFTPGHFAEAQRSAELLANSQLVPDQFKGKMPDCLLALDMSMRLKCNVLMVMQNLYIVYGRPAWSSTFIAAMINSSGRFNPLKFDEGGEGDERYCVAWTTEKGGTERIEGTKVTIGMAKADGWYSKKGSKWITLPTVMLRYRAISFFGKVYAPDLMLGMQTQEEVIDIHSSEVTEDTDEIPMGKIGLVESPKEEEAAEPAPAKPKRKRTKKTEAPAPAPADTGEDLESLKNQAASEPEVVAPEPKEESVETKLTKVLEDHGMTWSDFVYFMRVEQGFDVEKSGAPKGYITSILRDPSSLIAGIEQLKSGH